MSTYVFSENYCDDQYEYRYVVGEFPVRKLLTEDKWRAAGIKMSRGWEHYQLCPVEENLYLFRRRLVDSDQCTFNQSIDALVEKTP